jgi:hypothetical protein
VAEDKKSGVSWAQPLFLRTKVASRWYRRSNARGRRKAKPRACLPACIMANASTWSAQLRLRQPGIESRCLSAHFTLRCLASRSLCSCANCFGSFAARLCWYGTTIPSIGARVSRSFWLTIREFMSSTFLRVRLNSTRLKCSGIKWTNIQLALPHATVKNWVPSYRQVLHEPASRDSDFGLASLPLACLGRVHQPDISFFKTQ